MKRTLLAIAACLGLAAGALGATSTAADARVSVSIGFGYYGGYPCCYYPRYYPRYYAYPVYPYRVYPYVQRRVVCHDVVRKKVYWRNYAKHVVYIRDRVCRRVY